MHTAGEVAKWFLSYNRYLMNEEDSDYISNLKLQKLLYYAQGVFLAVNNEALFSDSIVAWKHGPVVESIYHDYKQNGSNGIVFDEEFNFDDFSEAENNLLKEVYDVFGQYSAWRLREMTHGEKPWLETEQSEEIEQDRIKAFFESEYVD